MKPLGKRAAGTLELLMTALVLLIAAYLIIHYSGNIFGKRAPEQVDSVLSCTTFDGICADECPAGYMKKPPGKKGTPQKPEWGCPPKELPDFYKDTTSPPDPETLGYCCVPVEPSSREGTFSSEIQSGTGVEWRKLYCLNSDVVCNQKGRAYFPSFGREADCMGISCPAGEICRVYRDVVYYHGECVSSLSQGSTSFQLDPGSDCGKVVGDKVGSRCSGTKHCTYFESANTEPPLMCR